MNAPDHWNEISRIYLGALEVPAAGRAAYMERACAGEPLLRRELEWLLQWYSDSETFMGVPAFDVMATALAAQATVRAESIDVARIRDVFALALERPTAERLQFLERAYAMLVVEAERTCTDDRRKLPRDEGGAHTPHARPGVCPSCHATIGASDLFCRACGTPVAGHAAGDGGRFRAGTLFAGRFRIAGMIGRGGMGEVYRCEDLELGQTVALKFLTSVRSDQGARARLRNEVRLARQISHPNVCRVYDIGEAHGDLYLSMEYVDGEDLAALLKRIGRVPIDKGIDIARNVAAGLAAAHATGVLHRDLKPGNIMIDGRGGVRVMDFGLATFASALPGADVRSGTPAYMAPEQLAGREATTSSDIYALGLVLYELFTGKRPIGTTDPVELLRRREHDRPVAPTKLLPELVPAIDAVILRCLHPDPRKRPTSALAVAAELPMGMPIGAALIPGDVLPRPAVSGGGASPVVPADSALVDAPASVATRRPPTQRLVIVGVAALGVAAALAAIFAMTTSPFAQRQASALTEQDFVVLAEFENHTDDPIFDGALKVALAVALEQSPFLKIYPEGRARETLRLMQRSPDEPVTRVIAQEIARREQLKALLTGSIAPLGRNYVVALEAVNAETGDVIAREQAEAAGKEQVLTAIGAAASRLREKLGESLASVQKFDASLPRATTASLDALHAYALALVQGREVPRLDAIPHLRRAIEIDPAFAMALAQLSLMYANTGQPDLAPPFSRKAFELRDMVSERERYFISWRYYVDVEQDWEKALELAQSWTASYPREASAFNSLGIAFTSSGQFEQALAPFRDAIRLDPSYVPAYSNLAAAQMSLGRSAEGQATLQQAADRRLDFNGTRRLTYLIAFIQRDDKTMTRVLDSSVGLQATNAAFGWQAHGSAFYGRVSTAHEQFRRGIQMSQQSNFHEVSAQLALEDAEIHAIVGQCDDAREEAQAGLEVNRGYAVLGRATRVFALCGPGGTAASLAGELVRRFPNATLAIRIQKPLTDAAVALQRGDPGRAIELLDAIKPYDYAPAAQLWPVYLRGQAYLQLKDGRSAAAQFRNLLNNRGVAPQSPLYPLGYLALARAATLQGDGHEARRAYEELLSMWKDADPALQPLKDARAELARLP